MENSILKTLGFKTIGMIVLLLIIFATSCEKSIETLEPENQIEEVGKFKKELTVYDAISESNLIVLVSSDDENFINELTSEMFDFNPIFEINNNSNELLAIETDETEASNQGIEIHIQVISLNLGDKAVGYELSYTGSKNNLKSTSPQWVTTYFYAYTPKTTMLITNYSCQKGYAKFWSKTKSWYWWSDEGARFLPANGGYWEFTRTGKYGLRISLNYDASCGTPPVCTSW